MSELNVYHHELRPGEYDEFYLKYEANKAIAENDAEIARLKNRIAPKQSDRTLQERLNKVCEKHGVSTLQDLDWAFCESEKMRTRDCIEAAKELTHHKYKRCLAMARWCKAMCGHYLSYEEPKWFWYRKWSNRWLELAEKFKPNKSTAH